MGTEIAFSIDSKDGVPVTLTIFDISGCKLKTLVSGSFDRGKYTVKWNGKDESGRVVPSGVYLYRLRAGNTVKTKKLVLIK